MALARLWFSRCASSACSHGSPDAHPSVKSEAPMRVWRYRCRVANECSGCRARWLMTAIAALPSSGDDRHARADRAHRADRFGL